MASKEEVAIKMGVDNSAISRGLVSAQDQIKGFGGSVKKELSSLKSSFSWFSKINILSSFISQMPEMMNKAKELGQWWGAFTVGGEKAVRQIGQAEREIERLRKETRKLNEERLKDEKELEDAKKNLGKTIRDILFEESSHEEKINLLYREKEELADKLIEAKEDLTKKLIIENDLEKKSREILKEQREIEKEKKTLYDKAFEAKRRVLDLEQKLADTREQAEARKLSGYQPTIEELADSPNSPFSLIAQQIKDKEKMAKEAFIAGDINKAKGLVQEIEGGEQQVNVAKGDFNKRWNPVFETQKIKGLKDILSDKGVIEKRDVDRAIIETQKELAKANVTLTEVNKKLEED